MAMLAGVAMLLTSCRDTAEIVLPPSTLNTDINIHTSEEVSTRENCRVSPKNITVLSNGIAFDFDYSQAENVAHYYRGYIEASRIGLMTNPEIISELQHNFKRHLPSDDEVADFSGLRPNTEYAIYTLAYDIEGKRGELLKTIVKTRPSVENEPCALIGNVTVYSNQWEWFVTRSVTCAAYWQMATEVPEVANASDVKLAWLLEDAIRQNRMMEYCSGGKWQMARNGNTMTVWTLGRYSNGTIAGEISSKRITTSSLTKAKGRPLSQTQNERNVAGDHSGRKLSPDQYQLYLTK